MKKIISLLVLFFCQSTLGATTHELPSPSQGLMTKEINSPTNKSRPDYCTNATFIITFAMQNREAGIRPQDTIKNINIRQVENVSEVDKKALINAAYFDPTLSKISYRNMMAGKEIYDSCMRDWKPRFQPLK